MSTNEAKSDGALFGLLFALVALAVNAWLLLCVTIPRSLWKWLWLRVGRRGAVSLMLAPWVLAFLVVVVPIAISRGNEPAFAPIMAAVERFTHPGPGDRSAGSSLATMGLLLLGLPSLVSIIFGGPLWVVFLAWTGACRLMPWTIDGRQVVWPRLGKVSRWRRRADEDRVWYVGASATKLGKVSLGSAARRTHTWVVGATGTGKTQSVLLPMLRSDILAGQPVVFIDGKGDRETLAAVWHLARQAGREGDFRYFDLRQPDASCTYSPFLNGSANEQADKIMAALRWDNEYYRSQSHSVLLRLVRALRATGLPYSLEDLQAALSSLPALRALASLVPETQREAELVPIVGRWKDYQVETAGMRAQLDSLLLTDFGSLLADPEPTLDLARAYAERSIVYFALPVARFPQTAPLVAKLVIGDLNSVAGLVQDGTLPRTNTSVVIDEFAAFAMPLFIDLLNKARSAGMALTISHQSMRGDLATAGEGYVGQVADNTNVKICLRQSEDAEYVAGLAGTRAVVKRTEQTMKNTFAGEAPTGLGSARDADEYRVSPNVIRQLPLGVALVKVDQPGQLLDLVALDFLDSSQFSPFPVHPQERSPRSGLSLATRMLGARQMGSPACRTLKFNGA